MQETDAPLRLPTAKGFAGSVLLIEDDEAVRQAISMVLIEQGYRIVAAANPAHAIGLLELGIRVGKNSLPLPLQSPRSRPLPPRYSRKGCTHRLTPGWGKRLCVSSPGEVHSNSSTRCSVYVPAPDNFSGLSCMCSRKCCSKQGNISRPLSGSMRDNCALDSTPTAAATLRPRRHWMS